MYPLEAKFKPEEIYKDLSTLGELKNFLGNPNKSLDEVLVIEDQQFNKILELDVSNSSSHFNSTGVYHNSTTKSKDAPLYRTLKTRHQQL